MLAVYGPTVHPEPLSFDEFVQLWLNLPRQRALLTWSLKEALDLSLGGHAPGRDLISLICDSPEEADELAYSLHAARVYQEALSRH
jgi:hypothetical protein